MLGRRRIYLLPTAPGFLFVLALVLMLLGAINYNLALGHALVFLLAGLGPIGMVHAYRNLAGITLTPGQPEAVFAGETAHFPVYLGEDRHEERWGLEIGAQGNPPVHCMLAAHGQTGIALPIDTRQRGRHPLPELRVTSRYPLGLFRAWSPLRFGLEFLVYPQPLLLPLPSPAPSASTGSANGDAGQEDFAGLRPRQPADSPRHIAWKAAARDDANQPLLVKQFAGGAQSELWLDWSRLPESMDPETRLSVLTGWVITADSAGFRYGLALPGIAIPPAEGTAHRCRCLEQLAQARV